MAQINCSEIAKHDNKQLLPKIGMLYFFYCQNQDAWGYDPADIDKFKVCYIEDISDLKRSKPPRGIEKYALFKSCSLQFKKVLNISSRFNLNQYLTDDEIDVFWNQYYSQTNGVSSKMLGFPDPVQNEMEAQCEMTSKGVSSGSLTIRDIEKGNKGDWILLFQISSYENLDIMWCDAGCLYFWIKKSDLQERDFDKVWCILQST